MLPSSGNEAPNVMEPLDQDILITGSNMLGASLPKDESRAGLRNLVFFRKVLDDGQSPKRKKEKEKGDYANESSTTVKVLQC